MSKFGWSLPPGCSIKDLPGNSPVERAQEAFFDQVFDQLPATMLEYDKEKIAEWVWNQVGQAYADGYQQAHAEAKQAADWNEAADFVIEDILKKGSN